MSSKTFWVSFTSLVTLSFIIGFMTAQPHIKDEVRAYFYGDKREILATAKIRFMPETPEYLIVKVQGIDSIYLEIYEASEPPSYIGRSVMSEKKDGYLNFRGNAANLAFEDVDRDGVLEVIAPVYDDNLVPRLHIFKWDAASRILNLMSPQNISL